MPDWNAQVAFSFHHHIGRISGLFSGFNMDFDNLFDEAMLQADRAVEDAMASEFHLSLRDGTNLDIKAIFDASLEYSNKTENRPPFVAEDGALTVLNNRLDKKMIEGASTQTPLGVRHVADVFYPDYNTTIIILSERGAGSFDGDFLKQ